MPRQMVLYGTSQCAYSDIYSCVRAVEQLNGCGVTCFVREHGELLLRLTRHLMHGCVNLLRNRRHDESSYWAARELAPAGADALCAHAARRRGSGASLARPTYEPFVLS